jgi:hypothetical protein
MAIYLLNVSKSTYSLFFITPSLPSPTGEGVKTFTPDRKMELKNYSENKIISHLGETGKRVN